MGDASYSEEITHYAHQYSLNLNASFSGILSVFSPQSNFTTFIITVVNFTAAKRLRIRSLRPFPVSSMLFIFIRCAFGDNAFEDYLYGVTAVDERNNDDGCLKGM